LSELETYIKRELSDQFKTFVLALWTSNFTDLIKLKLNGYEFYTTQEITDGGDIGLDLRYLKNYPVAKLLRERANLTAALEFTRYLFLACASKSPPQIQNSLIEIMESKMVTMRQMQTQMSYAKGALQHACHSIKEDYKKLANRSEDISVIDFFCPNLTNLACEKDM
jgi:hypothetical protein